MMSRPTTLHFALIVTMLAASIHMPMMVVVGVIDKAVLEAGLRAEIAEVVVIVEKLCRHYNDGNSSTGAATMEELKKEIDALATKAGGKFTTAMAKMFKTMNAK